MKMKVSRFVQILIVFTLAISGLQVNTSISQAAGYSCPNGGTYGKDVDRAFWFDVLKRLAVNGPIEVRTEFSIKDFAFAIEALSRWVKYEGTLACWNPIGTTWDTGPGTWTLLPRNPDGVKSYLYMSNGVQATTATMSKFNTDNSDMKYIRMMLARQGFDKNGVTRALNMHSNYGPYVSSLVNEWEALYNSWKFSKISWTGASRKYSLDVQRISRSNGELIYLWTDISGLNQRWQFKKLSSGSYQIISLNSGKCLDLKNGNTSNGAPLHQWTCYIGNLNQEWSLLPISSGVYKIKSVKSGKCIDLLKGTAYNGAKVQMWDCQNGNGNQLWVLQLP